MNRSKRCLADSLLLALHLQKTNILKRAMSFIHNIPRIFLLIAPVHTTRYAGAGMRIHHPSNLFIRQRATAHFMLLHEVLDRFCQKQGLRIRKLRLASGFQKNLHLVYSLLRSNRIARSYFFKKPCFCPNTVLRQGCYEGNERGGSWNTHSSILPNNWKQRKELCLVLTMQLPDISKM